ncbi:phytanoyl-CoA dioxygenase family protein [Streptomyces sp. NPDC059009]|uniref:phytanoyl-CoA dioxygenase family protein n=1 Tax=Streptomyces sp. NPDC059009 TaxID=3346694 RepID=UPI0036A13F22
MSAGLLGEAGHRLLDRWCRTPAARGYAAELIARYQPTHAEVVHNPHHTQEWAQAIVRAPLLVNPVRDMLGPDIAVENSFLVIKWPGRAFEVPWHQDGINDRLRLAPGRSVAAWLALTDAPLDSGCLHVVPGSQRAGYLAYDVEQNTGAARGRALGAKVADGTVGVPVPVEAGQGLLMDTRLLHCSHTNHSQTPRVGLNIRYVAPDAVTMRDDSSPSLVPICGTGWQPNPH